MDFKRSDYFNRNNNDNDQMKMAFSVEEVSKMTTLSKAFLRNEIRAGNLKVKRIGRRVLVLPEDLQKYLRQDDEKEMALA